MKLKMWELVKNLISMIESLERELEDAEAEVGDLKLELESSQEDNAQLTLSIVRGITP
jgi:regulator of replication initiation timing